jgi:outer membrane lipoprotein-sorting protein
MAAVLSGFILTQASPEDILVWTYESMEKITDAHAVVELRVDNLEKVETATVELWGRKGEDGPGAFRLEVLETSEEKAAGAVVVSDGETLWAYTPSKGKVYVGTLEEAKDILAEKDFDRGDYDKGDFEHPENAEEAVQKLLEYFKVEKIRTEDEVIGDNPGHLLELEPIPDQMPTEYAAVGGYINLWIDSARQIPFAIEYTGGSLGEFSATATQIDINPGVENSRFLFEMPADVEVVNLADLAPKSLSLEEASAAAEFELLTPSETPAGATLVDILEVRGSIIQRYTLPDGGSFSVAQGISNEVAEPPAESQTVEVRGVDGKLFVAEGGDKVLLTWNEGDVLFTIAGTLTPDQALMVAESLN